MEASDLSLGQTVYFPLFGWALGCGIVDAVHRNRVKIAFPKNMYTDSYDVGDGNVLYLEISEVSTSMEEIESKLER